MPFQQTPPELGNQYEDDRVLRSYLARVLPGEMLREIENSLRQMGELAGGELYRMQLEDRLNEPKLTQCDAWGNRIDEIELTPLWRRAERIAAEHGVVATAYEQKHGALSRVHQCALAYLFTPSTDIYSCPLAMTDGAARTLISSGNQTLIDRAVPHLTTRDPGEFWTAGQWMTELTGGSDVGLSETLAKEDSTGDGFALRAQCGRDARDPSKRDLGTLKTDDSVRSFRLYGRKWFTSAVSSQIALMLARPEGNPPGSKGLALFYVETRDEQGRLRNIEINRLKDKLGTRKVPTAELTLDGTPALLVKSTTDGVRTIAPLLNITRLWNGISAVALMRRGLALAFDYASKRVAFGAPLSEKPLHMDTLFGLEAEFEAAFHLAFYVGELNGRYEVGETGELDENEARLLRVLTPIMKLTTGKQAVMVASEVLEAFGGAGYIEDTGLPVLLRDSQVLPIWEGTTNVLALDTLRALGDDGVTLLQSSVASWLESVSDPKLVDATTVVRSALDHAERWLHEAQNSTLEAGARRFAMTLGRTMELALLIKHAQWSQDQERDGALLRLRGGLLFRVLI
jgi:acyl-CoA dehydrogenase